ncbi:MAG TPA: FtsX-like permease family protein [Candidatus Eisenbacteria bacterium]|nr:FtsX-like permease family protein [Candidatus Eisenbacteria bacterium]
MQQSYEGPFSLLRMFWGNLAARPLRCALSIVAIAIQVVLVLMIVGMTSGIISEWGKRVEGVGADLLVQPPNSSIFFAFSSAVMPEAIGDEIAKLPDVDETAPTLVVSDPKTLIIIYGIDYKRFNALSQGFIFRAGGPMEGPDDALADDIIAQTRHLKVGDNVTLINHQFKIVGIVAHGKGARYFIPLKTGQEVIGADSHVSMVFVRTKGNTEAARAEILKLDPQNRVRSMAEYVSLMNSSSLPELKPFIRTMVGLGVIISFLVVLMNMHTMILERTREIGILKALGFSRLDVVKMFLSETAALTVAGSLLGIGVTFLAKAILKQANPGLAILITPGWVLGSLGLALIGAALGAAVPAFRASSVDPVEALAYE